MLLLAKLDAFMLACYFTVYMVPSFSQLQVKQVENLGSMSFNASKSIRLVLGSLVNPYHLGLFRVYRMSSE